MGASGPTGNHIRAVDFAGRLGLSRAGACPRHSAGPLLGYRPDGGIGPYWSGVQGVINLHPFRGVLGNRLEK